MIDLNPSIKFESLTPFPGIDFYIFRRGKNVIGYVQNFNSEGWHFYFGNIFSLPYSTKDEAVDGLLSYTATHDFDLFAKQTGTFDNPEYTKGR